MIDIKDVKYDPTESVRISSQRLKELIEAEDAGFTLYKKLREEITRKYVENYACFGNGGAITYEELAKLLNIELPKVAHIGMDAWLKVKKEVWGEENG